MFLRQHFLNLYRIDVHNVKGLFITKSNEEPKFKNKINAIEGI
jgi:hypothetical protein